MKNTIALVIWAVFIRTGMAFDFPDPLLMNDGTPVKTRKQWEEKRRPELKALFQREMYGQLPPKPEKIDFKVESEHNFFGGKAVMKNVTISFSSPDAPRIDLLLISPNNKKKNPAFLVLNFCGNHAIMDDPRVPLTRGWMYPNCKGCTNNHATEAARGGQANDWPLEEIIGRGYSVATFCNTDVDSDRADISDGVYKWLNPSAPPHDRGTIAAWAWGFHRALDYLVTDKSIDPKRVAALGAAFDERFALAIPHQAGCGGTAPSRGTIGESVKRINDNFPHWFNAAFKKYNDAPEKLPFDQNCLAALMAPRPVLFSNAVEDQWANPSGQFEVLKAAEPIYKLLKAGGLAAEKMPEPGKLVNSNLGYFIRPGKHSMTREDWMVFLDFADKNL